MSTISSKQLLRYLHSLRKKIQDNVDEVEVAEALLILLNEIEREIVFIRDMNANTDAIIIKTPDEEYHQDEIYTAHELETAYCIGFLNQEDVSFDQMMDDTPNLRSKWRMGKKFIDIMVRKKRLSNTIQIGDKTIYR